MARDFDWTAPRKHPADLLERAGDHLIWGGEPETYEALVRAEHPGLLSPSQGVEPACAAGLCIEHVTPVNPMHPDYPPHVCVYCGEPADSRDHLRSRGWTGNRTRATVAVVPSCRECNSLIGDTFEHRVEGRREIVHKKLRAKNRSDLAVVLFGESDLAAMGPTLRAATEAAAARHVRLIKRLSWPVDPDYDIKARLP